MRNREKIATFIFYLGITIELLCVLYDKSALYSLNVGLYFRITFLLFTVKVLMTRYSVKEWIVIALFGIVGFISYRCSGRNDMLRLVVMCAAFKDIDYKKVMRYTFYVMSVGCLLIMALAFLGVFGEMSMTAKFRGDIVQTRYTFGFGHPNQMHCMFWAVATLGIFCFWEKINWIWLGGLMTLNIILYLFTDSRGGLIGMTMTFLLSMVLKYVKHIREAKWPYILTSAALVFVGIFSVALAYFGWKIYHKDYPEIWTHNAYQAFYRFDEKFLSGRLWLCYGLIQTDMRNFKLFSQPANTEFMDVGFYKLFYWYGYIPAILYLVACILLVRYAYRKKDYAIMMIVTSFSAYTFLEAHLISNYLGRNYLFFIMGGLWSAVLCGEQKDYFGWWELPSKLYRLYGNKRKIS